MNITCIILAAGSSSRMTKYKQLLTYQGKSFIRLLVEKLKAAKMDDLLCVTGFLKNELERELHNFDIKYIHNTSHLSGQTNSLKLALNQISEKDSAAALITLTDQPLIPLKHYQNLVAKHKTNPEAIIATNYADTHGAPSIIPKKYFNEIIALADDASPKIILNKYHKELILISCEEAAQDIDSDEDYNKLIGKMSERYSRQILLDEVGKNGQQKLQKSHVAIVGCGGLGAIAAAYLAGAGVGKMTLIDGDLPGISNVHRQILYTGQEQESKAHVLKGRLNSLNPEVQIEIHSKYLTKENINECLTGVGIILECTDNIMCKYLVNDFAALDQIPLVYGAIHKYEGYVSTFLNRSEKDLHLRDIFPYPDETIPTCAEVGVLNTIAGMIGLLQANEAIKLILEIGELLAGKLLTYDCLSNRQMILKMKKSWDQDLDVYYENSSYSPQDCSFVPELEIVDLLKDRAKYTLISVMSTTEHQAIDAGTIHNPQVAQGKNAITSLQKPVVLYCKYGKNSKRIAAKLLSEVGIKKILNLKGGFQAYQKFQNTGSSNQD